MRFEGVYVATLTPFDDQGKLVIPRLLNHLEFLVKGKVDGFVPCATTGEAPTLEPEERKRVLEETLFVARSYNLKVIAGCGSNSTPQALAYCEEAAKLGAQGALVVTPYYNKPTQAGLIQHYHFIADRSPLPVILYNVPSRTGVSFSLDTITYLLEHPNIVGIKESSGNFNLWLDLHTRVDLSKKSFLAGDDDAFSTILSFKGCGIISATANLIPLSFTYMYSAFLNKRWDEVFRVQLKIAPLIKAMFMETNPAPLKFLLHHLNRDSGVLRLPLVPVSAQTQESIIAVLDQLLSTGEIE